VEFSSKVPSVKQSAAEANALFLKNFENWVTASIKCSEHGNSPEQRVKNIRSSYVSAIKGNIEYHTLIAKAEEVKGGDKDNAALHRAMADAYHALVLES
jgi:hypothetical protein